MTNRDEYAFDIPTFEEIRLMIEAAKPLTDEENAIRFVDYLDIIH